ncbi:phage tail tip lysozyme, partial [Lachnospiraceae bacterium 46-15]
MEINVKAEKRAYRKFTAVGMTPYGACGLIANLEAESDGFYPNRVEYLCLRRLKEKGKNYTDESYTKAIDAGKLSCEQFLHPLPGKQYGYGLAQWTSPARKAGLWNLARRKGVSIANEDMQIEYLLSELSDNYPDVLKVLKTTRSIREASDIVLTKFECPADTGEAMRASRASRGQKFYDTYVKTGKVMEEEETMDAWEKTEKLMSDQVGYLEKASNANLNSKTGNTGYNNYTKFARDVNSWGLMGCQGQPWCA